MVKYRYKCHAFYERGYDDEKTSMRSMQFIMFSIFFHVRVEHAGHGKFQHGTISYYTGDCFHLECGCAVLS